MSRDGRTAVGRVLLAVLSGSARAGPGGKQTQKLGLIVSGQRDAATSGIPLNG